MGFQQLIDKVKQAEDTLEAKERHTVGQLKQLKSSWREAWTPGRIIVAGLAAGFLVGRADPLRTLGKSGGLIQLVSMVSGLFAGTSAQVAAEGAEQAADAADIAARAAAPGTVARSLDDDVPDEAALLARREAEALARGEATAQVARAAAVDSSP